MAVTLVDERDDHTAWDDYVGSHKQATLYHLAAWRGLIKRVFGHSGYYFCARDSNDRVCGVLPLVHQKSLLFGNNLFSMPYVNYGGMLADSEQIEQQLMVAAAEQAGVLGAKSIEYRDTRLREGMPVKQDKVSMILELPESPEALGKIIGSKRRARIRRPMREGPVVHKGSGPELLEMFYPVFAENMRDLGTPVYSKAFFQHMLDNFSEHAYMVIITLADKPVAGAFLLGYRDTLEIPWASTLRAVNKLSINMLLYWEVLSYAMASNYRYFDFGRSTKDSNTYRFKKQWGTQERPLYWHYWLAPGETIPQLNPHNPSYQLAVSAWKNLPLWLANGVGPLLVKNLP